MFIIVSLYASLLLNENSHACSCIQQSQKEAYESAEAVFRGKVMDITKSKGSQRVRLIVNKVWKGSLGATAEVTTAQSSATCGVQFQHNREYVVFTLKGKKVTTNSCTNTDLVDSPRGGGAITWLDINRPAKTP